MKDNIPGSLEDPNRLDRLLLRKRKLYEQLQKLDSHYVSLRVGRPVSIKNIQNILKSKLENQIIVEYDFLVNSNIGEEDNAKSSKLIIIVVSSTQIDLIPVDVSKDDIENLVKKYRDTLGNFRRYINSNREKINKFADLLRYENFNEAENILQALSVLLIEPISVYLQAADSICFVPHDVIHYLPLHALFLNGKPILEKAAIRYSPSASLLLFQKRTGQNFRTCASFGVEFTDEAKDVAILFGADRLLM